MIVRGMRFRDEDDALDYFEQRDLDDAAEAAAFHEEQLQRQHDEEEGAIRPS